MYKNDYLYSSITSKQMFLCFFQIKHSILFYMYNKIFCKLQKEHAIFQSRKKNSFKCA